MGHVVSIQKPELMQFGEEVRLQFEVYELCGYARSKQRRISKSTRRSPSATLIPTAPVHTPVRSRGSNHSFSTESFQKRLSTRLGCKAVDEVVPVLMKHRMVAGAAHQLGAKCILILAQLSKGQLGSRAIWKGQPRSMPAGVSSPLRRVIQRMF